MLDGFWICTVVVYSYGFAFKSQCLAGGLSFVIACKLFVQVVAGKDYRSALSEEMISGKFFTL
jgi:hypothetical protein